jgi:tetratricopeptide (TPR) repeat protein
MPAKQLRNEDKLRKEKFMADMDANAYYNRGLNEEDCDQAIADFDEAIKINPNWANVYDSRGCMYCSKKDYDKAIADFNEAIRINPKESVFYRHRGDAYGDKGDYNQNIADCTEAIRIDSDDRLKFKSPNSVLTSSWAKAYNSRGVAYMETKKYKEAITDFEDAVALHPEEEMYRDNLVAAKNVRRRSNKLIWAIAGAVIGAIIGGINGGGYGVFFGAIIGAFPIPIIKFVWNLLFKQ